MKPPGGVERIVMKSGEYCKEFDRRTRDEAALNFGKGFMGFILDSFHLLAP
jgi:hypothetical protein